MRALVLIACAVLAGCASTPPRPPTFCATLAGAGPQSDALDPEARGSAVLEFPDATSVRFRVQTSGIGEVIATHIHRGAKGENGPMAREINPGFKGDTFQGTTEGLPPELLAEIREHPDRFYLKLHSLRFPGGAIRGQLVACRERLER